MWNKESNFQREKNIHSQEVNDSVIILNPTAGKSHELNESGAFLWCVLETNKSYNELLSLFCEEYEVSTNTAEADLADFINEMHTQNLLLIND
jgi:hypothetical protein